MINVNKLLKDRNNMDKKRHNSPLVSIALPVYNEENHLRETLDSLIGQNYQNLEIIISDNCSEDCTKDICQVYAASDPRIIYHRQSSNIGVGPNFIFAMQKTRGKYSMWASGHDKWDPDCISKCIKSLENNTSATLAFGTPVWIGEDGNVLQKYTGWYDTRGMSPVGRFFMVFWGSMNPVLGIYTRKNIPDLRRYTYAGADLTLLGELALKGTFIHVTDTSLYRRQNRPVETHNDRMDRYKGKEMKITVSFISRMFPLAKLPLELLRAVLKSKITLLDKICIMFLLLPSIPLRYIVGKKTWNNQQ